MKADRQELPETAGLAGADGPQRLDVELGP